MINLLPTEEKNNLLRDYRLRSAITWLSTFLVIIILATVMLASCWAMLSYRTSALSKVLNSKKYEVSNKNFDNLAQVVKGTNIKLGIFLANTGEISSPSLALKRVVDKRRAGINVLGIAYERKSGASSTINIRGKSNDRNALLNFAAALRDDPMFTSVESPIANIIRQTNSDFTISAAVKFTE